MLDQNAWLFLFAGLSTVCAAGSFFLQIVDRKRRTVIKAASTDDHPVSPVSGRVVLSRKRTVVLVILLLVSATLSISGFISSIHREEPLKSSLRPENIEGTIHQWLDTFGVPTQKHPQPDVPLMRFELVATFPASKTPIYIFTRTDIDRYVVLQSSIAPGDIDRAKLDKMSKEELTAIANDLTTELAKAKVGWTELGEPLLSKVTLVLSIPITNSLTEATFFDKVNEMELDSILARHTLSAAIASRAASKAKQ